MKKFSLSILAASAMAVAGLAQADVIFYPDGTSVELGESGADQLAMESSIDTTTLGAGSMSMSSAGDSSWLGHTASSCAAGDSSCLDSQGMVTGFNDRMFPSENVHGDRVGLNDDPRLDTTVLGAAPARTATVTTQQYVYVQPNINWDRSTAMTQIHSNAHLMNRQHMDRSAAATFNTPTRAGEASTMTGGAPNKLTTNDRVVVGSYSIPHSAVNGPYYVFSY